MTRHRPARRPESVRHPAERIRDRHIVLRTAGTEHYNLDMSHPDVSIRCQRCGAQMDLKDPGPPVDTSAILGVPGL